MVSGKNIVYSVNEDARNDAFTSVSIKTVIFQSQIKPTTLNLIRDLWTWFENRSLVTSWLAGKLGRG